MLTMLNILVVTYHKLKVLYFIFVHRKNWQIDVLCFSKNIKKKKQAKRKN